MAFCGHKSTTCKAVFVRTKTQLAKQYPGWARKPFLSPWGAFKPPPYMIDQREGNRGLEGLICPPAPICLLPIEGYKDGLTMKC